MHLFARFPLVGTPLLLLPLLARFVSALPTSLAPRQLVNSIELVNVESRVEPSDDTYKCEPLRFTANFLLWPATVSIVKAPFDPSGLNLTFLDPLVATLNATITLDYAVSFPIGEKFALRLEDNAGDVAYSSVLEVVKAHIGFLDEGFGSPSCSKRMPSWYDNNRSWVEIIIFVLAETATLAAAIIALVLLSVYRSIGARWMALRGGYSAMEGSGDDGGADMEAQVYEKPACDEEE
ncbi:hypothetical protein JCM10207_007890 [Rhodosporidiobolus poonsookiae]